MKKLLLTLFIAAGAFTVANAQELAPDQNPNYMASLEKYKGLHDNLQLTMNTTVQDTYKAYDWRAARDERRAENREYNRLNYRYNGYNDYGYYNRNSYRPYYYHNTYRNNYRHNYYHRRHW